MIVETRKTPQGTEYWDTVEKRVRFVPTGDTAPFEITENPASMIMGVDMAKGPDMTAIDGEVVGLNPGIGIVDESITPLEDMTAKELRAYATELEIDIPDDIKKKADIIKLLNDAE